MLAKAKFKHHWYHKCSTLSHTRRLPYKNWGPNEKKALWRGGGGGTGGRLMFEISSHVKKNSLPVLKTFFKVTVATIATMH